MIYRKWIDGRHWKPEGTYYTEADAQANLRRVREIKRYRVPRYYVRMIKSPGRSPYWSIYTRERRDR